MAEQTDWADRWLGGFCTVGALGGLPVRGPDYAAHPPLDQLLPRPPAGKHPVGDTQAARAAWSDALGGASVVLVASVARARTLLLRALGVQPGEPVGLPANATRDLAEAVKHHPATPRWLDLAADLSLLAPAARLADVRVVWVQPLGGIGTLTPLIAQALLVDASDTLPALTEPLPHDPVAATIYGLHLHSDPKCSGALIVCADPTLALALEALCGPQDQLDPPAALAQLQRLAEPGGLAERQQAKLQAVREGLLAAAGLPLIDAIPGALAQHIAVRVPKPCDAATFYAYVLGEQTPVRWLPAQRPLHYAAIRRDGAPEAALSADRLARVLLVPVGPDDTAEEVKHAVLGITKAADYLGVRWVTDPARAAWYAQQMVEWYGPDHDAYRVLFALTSEAP
jgi:hypothetical protein